MRTFSIDLFVEALQRRGWTVVPSLPRCLLVGGFCELRIRHTPAAEYWDNEERREEYGDQLGIDVRWVPSKTFHRNGLTNYKHRFAWKSEDDLAGYLAKWKIKYDQRRDTHRIKAEYRRFRNAEFEEVMRRFSEANLDYEYDDHACMIWLDIHGLKCRVSFKNPSRPRIAFGGSVCINSIELVDTVREVRSVLKLASL